MPTPFKALAARLEKRAYSYNDFSGDLVAALGSGVGAALGATARSHAKLRTDAQHAASEADRHNAIAARVREGISAAMQGDPSLRGTASATRTLALRDPAVPDPAGDNLSRMRQFADHLRSSADAYSAEHARKSEAYGQVAGLYEIADATPDTAAAASPLLAMVGGSRPVGDHWAITPAVTALGSAGGQALLRHFLPEANVVQHGGAGALGALAARTGLRGYDSLKERLSKKREKTSAAKAEKPTPKQDAARGESGRALADLGSAAGGIIGGVGGLSLANVLSQQHPGIHPLALTAAATAPAALLGAAGGGIGNWLGRRAFDKDMHEVSTDPDVADTVTSKALPFVAGGFTAAAPYGYRAYVNYLRGIDPGHGMRSPLMAAASAHVGLRAFLNASRRRDAARERLGLADE